MSRTLEQVLADARGEAAVLRRAGHGEQADYVERLCADVAGAAHELLTWLGETEATLYAGRSVAYLRTKFPGWQRAGHARRGSSGGREYLLVALPRRADTSSAKAAGRRAAQQDRMAS